MINGHILLDKFIACGNYETWVIPIRSDPKLRTVANKTWNGQ